MLGAPSITAEKPQKIREESVSAARVEKNDLVVVCLCNIKAH